MNSTQKIKAIADHYGLRSQMLKMVEECAELTVEIVKLRTGSGDVKHLIEELADVKIVTEQLTHLLECEPELERWIEFKTNRQMARIAEEEKYKKIYGGK